MKKILIIVFVLVLFTSCGKVAQIVKEKVESSDSEKKESDSKEKSKKKKDKKEKDEKKDSNKKKDKKDKKKDDIKEEQTTTKQSEEDDVDETGISKKTRAKLFDFLEDEMYYDDEMDLFIEEYEDIDLDGEPEAIISIGLLDSNEDASANVVLYNLLIDIEDGDFSIIDQRDTPDHVYTDAKLVDIVGADNKMLYREVQDLPRSLSFELTGISADGFIDYISDMSADETYDYLVDKDDDGVYDGFIVASSGHLTYYQDMEYHYDFMDDSEGAFYITDTKIELEPYPDEPEDVVMQFLYLSDIYINLLITPDNLQTRIKELADNSLVEAAHWSSDIILHTLLEIEPMIGFETQINGDKAVVTTNVIGELTEELTDEDVLRKYYLEIVDDKWTITDMELIE